MVEAAEDGISTATMSREQLEPLARAELDQGRDEQPVDQLLTTLAFANVLSKAVRVVVAVGPLESAAALRQNLDDRAQV